MNLSARACLICLTALVAGCSASGRSGHASCRDVASTQAYGVQWMDDLAAARHAGKLSVDQVVDAHGESLSKLSLLKQEKWAEYCDHLDKVRKETGF